MMRAALLQMTSGIDAAANAERIADAMSEAKTGGADMLFTPEMALLLDRDRERAGASIVAEDDSAPLAMLRERAGALGLWLNLGLPVEREAGSKWVNRSLLIDGSGAIRARYDKIHLFDVQLATGETWRESSVYDAGTRPVVAQTLFGNLGLSICYDIRFPALYRALAQGAAAMLAIPAAFTVPTGGAHWHVLARARAIETGCFVIAAAQCGRHADGRDTYGHSLVVDPWGQVICDMGEGEGVAFADIDLAEVERARRQVPALANARPIGQAFRI